MKIMISGACGAIFYSYCNFIKNNGIDILGVDIRENNFTYNFLGNNFLKSPNPQSHPQEYLDFLQQNINNFDYFFPYSDEELLVVSKLDYESKLREKIIVSSEAAIEICNNKEKFKKFAIENDFPIPMDSNEVEKIIKPRFGRGGRNIFKVNDDKLIEPFRDSNEWLVADFIDGTEYSVDIVSDKNGSIIDSIARQRITTKGVSVEAKIDMNKRVINLAESIVSNLALFGPSNVQIIEQKDTKKLYVIEVNPRLSGGAIFSAKGGMDMIFLTLNYLGKKKNNINLKKDGEYYTRYWSDFTQ